MGNLTCILPSMDIVEMTFASILGQERVKPTDNDDWHFFIELRKLRIHSKRHLRDTLLRYPASMIFCDDMQRMCIYDKIGIKEKSYGLFDQ